MITIQEAYDKGFEDGGWKTGDKRLYNPPKGATGKMIAIGVILHRGSKVALSVRTPTAAFANQVTAPGGKVDATDQTLEAAAVRELKEETGLVIDRNRFRYVTSVNADNYVCAFFEVNVSIKEEPKNTEPHKHGDWYWYTVENALQLNLMSGLRAALETWRY